MMHEWTVIALQILLADISVAVVRGDTNTMTVFFLWQGWRVGSQQQGKLFFGGEFTTYILRNMGASAMSSGQFGRALGNNNKKKEAGRQKEGDQRDVGKKDEEID